MQNFIVINISVIILVIIIVVVIIVIVINAVSTLAVGDNEMLMLCPRWLLVIMRC